jgi:DNA-binding response OmpR family regulator
MQRPHQILILEDEPLLRAMLGVYLSTHGFRTLTAGSLREAETILTIMGWDWPDLVLCDANLSRDPDSLEGYRFHAGWRTRYPMPPFVFMRGGYPDVRLEGEDDCQVTHVAKPFHPLDLLLVLRAILA